MVWVAFELRPRAAALAILAFAAFAIGSALHAARGASIPNGSLLVLQLFLGVVALTSLLVSVAVSERNRHEQTLQNAKIKLEEPVFERTENWKTELRDRNVRSRRCESYRPACCRFKIRNADASHENCTIARANP